MDGFVFSTFVTLSYLSNFSFIFFLFSYLLYFILSSLKVYYCRIIIFSFCAYYQYKGNNSSHLSSTYGVLPVLVSTHLTPRKPHSEPFREARVCSHPTHLKAEPAGNVVTCSASHLE